MTHAARTHDLLDAIAEARDKLDSIITAENKREAVLHAELVRANAVALLQKISRQSRTSELDREAARKIADQLREVA